MAWPRNQSEGVLWIAKCKLHGMNQRVGVVYDEDTLVIKSLRSSGPGKGKLSVKVKIDKDRIEQTWRLAHKADEFEMLDLSKYGLVCTRQGDKVQLPFALAMQMRWH